MSGKKGAEKTGNNQARGNPEKKARIGFMKNEKVILAVLFLVSLSVRMIYFYQVRTNPFFANPVVDSALYDQNALELSAGNKQNDVFFGKAYHQAPLYTYFLSLIYKVFGHDYSIVRILQFIISSLGCVLMYLLAKRLTGKPAAVMAALVYSLYGTIVFYDGELLKPVLVIFFNLLGLWLLLSALRGTDWKRWFLAGVIFGLSAITRENILLFVPFVMLWMYFGLRKEMALKKIASYFLVFCSAIVLVILPVTVRNFIVEKDFVPVSSLGGLNFYRGNTPKIYDGSILHPGLYWNEFFNMPEKELGRDIKSSESSGWFYRESLKFIVREPMHWLRIMTGKFLAFWNAYEYTPNQPFYYTRESSSLLASTVFVLFGIYFPFGLIVPLALAGIILSFRESPKFRLLYLYLLSYVCSVVLFQVTEVRYRLPAVPVFIIFAAYLAYRVYRMWKEKEYRKLSGYGLVFLFFTVVINFGLSKPDAEKEMFQTDYFLGNVYRDNKLPDKAIRKYTEVINSNPEFLYAYCDRGAVFSELGYYDRALADYNRALKIDPGHLLIYFNKGTVYGKRGMYDEAIANFTRAIELDPGYAQAYNSRGMIYEKNNLPDEALADLNRVVELTPLSAEAYSNRGRVLEKKGLSKKALADYEKALELDPDNLEAYNNRGGIYEKRGLHDRTIDDLNRVIEMDSECAEGYYNRGRAYEKKGLLDLAVRDFKKAIEIKPGFVEAYINLGTVYYKKGKLDKAVRIYDEALKLGTGSHKVYSNLIAVYASKGRNDKAIESFQKGIKEYPDYPELYKNVGIVYNMMKQDRQAVKNWRKYIELYPNAPDAGAIRKAIENLVE